MADKNQSNGIWEAESCPYYKKHSEMPFDDPDFHTLNDCPDNRRKPAQPSAAGGEVELDDLFASFESDTANSATSPVQHRLDLLQNQVAVYITRSNQAEYERGQHKEFFKTHCATCGLKTCWEPWMQIDFAEVEGWCQCE